VKDAELVNIQNLVVTVSQNRSTGAQQQTEIVSISETGKFLLLGPSEWVLPEDGDRLQSPKRRNLYRSIVDE
jgi:hypothetical protein